MSEYTGEYHYTPTQEDQDALYLSYSHLREMSARDFEAFTMGFYRGTEWKDSALKSALDRVALLEEGIRFLRALSVGLEDDARTLKVNYDAIAYQLQERDVFCQSQGPENCPLKLQNRVP
jgi:hypothetical protein